MKQNILIIILSVLLVALIAVAAVTYSALSEDYVPSDVLPAETSGNSAAVTEEVETAPDFTMTDADGSEVSLSDTIETDGSGDSLYLLDVVGTDDTMLSDLQDKENCIMVRRAVKECLTEREADIIRRRYGLDGFTPQTQRQVAALYGISRSYV